MISIFPELALDSSIHIAVWVGLIVLWVFYETFGWVFAGFVVPGYLAAIFSVHPMSCIAIVFEAILTYGIVWFLGSGITKTHIWSRAFGRERFFLFLIFSVPVRIVVEGYAEIHLKTLFQEYIPSTSFAGGDFFSLGLVLVPLLANAFWKTGLSRGIFQMGTASVISYLILNNVLMRWTNYQLGHFDITFDDLAMNFLSAPRMYIVMLTTCFIAARNNVRYGWDFNGILVPGLLSVVAFYPYKFLTTLSEIIILVLVYRLLMKIPFISRINFEGARRSVSMYSLGIALKWIIAVVAQFYFPTKYVSDFFGYGYLLTSLVAIKCFQKRSIPIVMLPVVITTIQGCIAGIGISMLLSFIVPTTTDIIPSPSHNIEQLQPTSLEHSMLLAHSTVKRTPLTVNQTESAMDFMKIVQKMLATNNVLTLKDIEKAFENYPVVTGWAERFDKRKCIVIRELRITEAEASGIPSIWWCGGRGPALLVPYPLTDATSLIQSSIVAQHADFSIIVMSGSDTVSVDLANDTFLARQNTRYNKNLREMLGYRSVWVAGTTKNNDSSFLETKSGNTKIDFGALHYLLPSIDVKQNRVFHEKLESWWQILEPQDGLFVMSLKDQNIIATAVSKEKGSEKTKQHSKDEYVDMKTAIEGLSSNEAKKGYQKLFPSTLEDRLFLAEQIFPVLFEIAKNCEANDKIPELVYHLANLIKYDISIITDENGSILWLLKDTLPAARGFGHWIIRPNIATEWFLVAPYQVDEPGLAGVSMKLLSSLNGRFLWLNNASKDISYDIELDPLQSIIHRLPFTQLAIRQLIMPKNNEEFNINSTPTRVLTLRSFDSSESEAVDIVLSMGYEVALQEEQDLIREEIPQIIDIWPNLEFMDGGAEKVGTNGGYGFFSNYMNALTEKQAYTLWFSEDILSVAYGNPQRNETLNWYRQIGIPVLSANDESIKNKIVNYQDVKDLPVIFALMKRHIETRAEAPLKKLKKYVKNIVVVENAMSIQLWLWDNDFICRVSENGKNLLNENMRDGCWRTK